MTVSFLDVCKFVAASAGTGDFVAASIAAGYLGPGGAGAVNGATYRYRAESADLSQWEIGTGKYSSTTNSFARSVVRFSSTGSKIAFTNAPVVGIVFFGDDLIQRELLTADRDYYVATTGSNSNDGLTVGAPFLTIQKALDIVAQTLDIGISTVRIRVADGTYSSSGNTVNGPWVGQGSVYVIGNATTPANVVVSCTGVCFLVTNRASLFLQSMKVTSSAAGSLTADAAGHIDYSNMDFGSCGGGSHVRASEGGSTWTISSAHKISGAPSEAHITAAAGGIARMQSCVVTIPSAAAMGFAFVRAVSGGIVNIAVNTYTGKANVTGLKFHCTLGGCINTASADLDILPGDAGSYTLNNGGSYDGASDVMNAAPHGGAYTMTQADTIVIHPAADTTARIYTIDSNANLPLKVGHAFTFINQNGAGVITIAITSDVMRLAGPGTTGSRTLAANGVATAVKITATEWIISGVGLT